MKLIDKIRQRSDDQPFYSFEYFPPKTAAGVENLYLRIARMGKLHPLFVDVTWGAGGSTAELSLDISSSVLNVLGLETMMHLTCTNLSRRQLAEVLSESREKGIQNILALRGDPPRGASTWNSCADGFAHAIDLVRFIREEHGDYFGICVAGYPDGHPEAASYEEDLRHLQAKVEAGADLVITQLFYDCDAFLSFTGDCRTSGIDCPIIPGLMPIHNYQTFSRVARYSTSIPQSVAEAIEPIKQDDAAVRAYGIEHMEGMCRQLLASGVKGLHFYTLNLEKTVTEILRRLAVVPAEVERVLPWRSSANEKRRREDVRPIFWANRPHSYHARTMAWDEFPNGRWGDSGSPAFGELTDYHWRRLHSVDQAHAEMWGESLRCFEDICEVFVRFCRGEIPALPWFDAPLALETESIRQQLVRLNRRGFLTINSQPRVNAAPAEDPAVGWGAAGGVVYQKAYLELFVSEELLPTLLDHFARFPSLTFHAINHRGAATSNCNRVNAVTWGVFPGAEIVQPTVVDPTSFEVWKDEAFTLWLSMWGSLYPAESPSRRLIEKVHDTFFLVNVVDNDFVVGDLWAVFDEILAELDDPSALWQLQTS